MRRFLLLLVLFATPIAEAAAANGIVSGVISDPAGGVVPGAIVELRTPAGALVRDTHTDHSGAFVIEVSLPNFAFATRILPAIACPDPLSAYLRAG